MPTADIEAECKAKVSEQISFLAEGRDRYRIFTPFRFDDGDRMSIVLKKRGKSWILSDEGNTFMRLSYAVNERELESGNRRKLIESSLAGFRVRDDDGELLLTVQNGDFGDALFDFVQALLHISDVSCGREISGAGE